MDSYLFILLFGIGMVACLPTGVRKPVGINLECYDDDCHKVRVTISEPAPNEDLVKMVFDAYHKQDVILTDHSDDEACTYYKTEESFNGTLRWCEIDNSDDIEIQFSQAGKTFEVTYDAKVDSYILVDSRNDVLAPIKPDEPKSVLEPEHENAIESEIKGADDVTPGPVPDIETTDDVEPMVHVKKDDTVPPLIDIEDNDKYVVDEEYYTVKDEYATDGAIYTTYDEAEPLVDEEYYTFKDEYAIKGAIDTTYDEAEPLVLDESTSTPVEQETNESEQPEDYPEHNNDYLNTTEVEQSAEATTKKPKKSFWGNWVYVPIPAGLIWMVCLVCYLSDSK